MENTQTYLAPIDILIRKGKISAVPGVLTITASEIQLEERSRMSMMFGLVGWLMRNWFPSTMHAMVPSEIQQVQKTTFGVNTEVLEFRLTDGTSYTVIVKPHMDAVVTALMKLGILVKPQA